MAASSFRPSEQAETRDMRTQATQAAVDQLYGRQRP
jgi:hypothetical protein